MRQRRLALLVSFPEVAEGSVCLWCCYPGVPALSCMRPEICKLPLSLLGCPGTAAEIATVGTVTVPLWGQKVPPPGQAEQPWLPRSVVIAGRELQVQPAASARGRPGSGGGFSNLWEG